MCMARWLDGKEGEGETTALQAAANEVIMH